MNDEMTAVPRFPGLFVQTPRTTTVLDVLDKDGRLPAQLSDFALACTYKKARTDDGSELWVLAWSARAALEDAPWPTVKACGMLAMQLAELVVQDPTTGLEAVVSPEDIEKKLIRQPLRIWLLRLARTMGRECLGFPPTMGWRECMEHALVAKWEAEGMPQSTAAMVANLDAAVQAFMGATDGRPK